MEIIKYTSYILCIGLVLSSVGPLQAEQAGRADEAREKMSLFKRSLKSFQRTWDRYNRCIRGKCSDEEKQKIKKELKSAAKKTAIAGLVVVGIVGVVASKFGFDWLEKAYIESALRAQQKFEAKQRARRPEEERRAAAAAKNDPLVHLEEDV